MRVHVSTPPEPPVTRATTLRSIVLQHPRVRRGRGPQPPVRWHSRRDQALLGQFLRVLHQYACWRWMHYSDQIDTAAHRRRFETVRKREGCILR